MKYIKDNDGSPNLIVSAVMFKAMPRVLKDREDITKISSGIHSKLHSEVKKDGG